MPTPFRTTRLVEFQETDAAGIVHFGTFFSWMEQAEHEMLRGLGLSVMMKDDGGKISWPRVHASCDFQSPLHFEDTVEIEIRVDNIGDKNVDYHFHFTCQGRAIAEGKMVAVCCRVERGEPLRSISIPPWIVEKLSVFRC